MATWATVPKIPAGELKALLTEGWEARSSAPKPKPRPRKKKR